MKEVQGVKTTLCEVYKYICTTFVETWSKYARDL